VRTEALMQSVEHEDMKNAHSQHDWQLQVKNLME
jgi:hypothetical protein